MARMASHPSRASIIEVAGIATAVCVALVTYLAYVLFSILATS
jgi:Flp pilus assembly pilin Flp